MIKKIGRIFLTITLFILNLTYQVLVIMLLQKLGLNFSNLNEKITIIINIAICISFMLILFLIYHKSLIREFKDYIKNFKSYFKIGLKSWLIGLLIMFISNILISLIYKNEAANETALQEIIKVMPLYMMFQTVIFAPFCEEIIFRKSIKDFIDNNIIYIIISGLIFGYVHTLNQTNILELLYIIPYGALGCAFAYSYTKTKNIYTPITLHMLHNFIAISISIISYMLAGVL